MTPPSIPVGTLLRQRYAIQQVLGQGGFSRTYLALDVERFNEPCVLKELAVPQQDGALLAKAEALFQREATVLYQIQHSQIPRFLAAFEDNQRLFSVQEFVDGQTYRHLLQERKTQGKVFSELEVLQFLSHLLPVLTYIHDRNIIHRDISLENIILRLRPSRAEEVAANSTLGLPILIDFGAVKSVANYLYTAFPSFSTSSYPSEITCVGKAGYAPPEQLQTGKVHPHSDLYALAATSLVLLTGKEPKTLLDSGTLNWQLRPYAQISDRFEAILYKMLSLRPGDRYQSAQAVLTELQPLLETAVPTTQLNSGANVAASAAVIAGSSILSSKLSQAMSGDRPFVQFGAANQNKTLKGSKKWHRWIGVSVGIAITLLLALTVPVLWRLTVAGGPQRNEVWVSGARIPQSEASQIIGSKQDANATSSRTNQAEPIQFDSGAISSVIQGNLQNQPLKSYVLRAAQGQIMTVALTGPEVTMNLLRSDQQGIDAAAYATQSWTGQLPKDDDYLIQVVGGGAYKLEVAITPLSQAIAVSTQAIARITIAPGATGAKVAGSVVPEQPRRYLLAARRGQTGVVKVIQGSVRIQAIAPNGQSIGNLNGQQPQVWRGKFPADGDYTLEISSLKPEKFTISLQFL
ncbi:MULTISPECIES: serine/threonine-protein kinase [Trichocoleus]|uniref:non-specific serine/threonine protein kinase n=1 Tax=Trichocoleus desertorum GB2-A4 TaxID=2933944 RepID=A0ABV0J7M1_9CYAN|nr:serine/threonine-protein kinase [Trichocoleus sp. FACHB-46]MBD1862135.1 serine/threonine protein kinase [Trichocoleus sp. FACHB-46]